MQKTVEGGACHDGVTGKDVCPFGKGLIGGDDSGRVFLVTVADGSGRAWRRQPDRGRDNRLR